MDPEEKSEFRPSSDGSLVWEWHVGSKGNRSFKASIWTGEGYHVVINDQIAAPAQ